MLTAILMFSVFIGIPVLIIVWFLLRAKRKSDEAEKRRQRIESSEGSEQ
jgi:cbb3-type cytochrome oxidase subunit 3